MKKNNKICVFLVVLFSVLFLFCTSSFASTDTYNFTGFDGIYYTLPTLPEGLNNYKYYVVINHSGNYNLFCFNETLEITRTDSFLTLNGDNNTTGKLFTCTNNTWKEFGEQRSYSFNLPATIIYSCQDLLQYKEYFDDENFSFPPQTVGILAPIYQKTRLVGVMKEILEILPVVLMTIVGLIGLRKALAFLSTVLHRS